MKKQVILLVLTILAFTAVNAQNALQINLNKQKPLTVAGEDITMDVEGYKGDHVIVQEVHDQDTPPAAAAGLFLVPYVNQSKNDSVSYKIMQTPRDDPDRVYILITGTSKHVHVKVPNNSPKFRVRLDTEKPDTRLAIKNYQGVFELETGINFINVSHVNGPFVINTSRAGKIVLTDILWSPALPGKGSDGYPYRINTKYADVDITLPEKLKARFAIYARKAYSDLDISAAETLNGGGVGIKIDNKMGYVYLRKKK